MPLRFDMGPFERLFIGKSVLTNNGNRAIFVVEGETPILRARDVVSSEQAVHAVQKLYRCVQQMYLEEDTQKYKRSYAALAVLASSECPAGKAEFRIADQFVKNGQHYQALKALKKLVKQEAFSNYQNSKLASA